MSKKLQTELDRDMPGTEGTNQYFLLVATPLGRLGVRPLVGARYRIRVEPASEKKTPKIAQTLTTVTGWKQPGDNGQDRFSIVCHAEVEVAHGVLLAARALQNGVKTKAVNAKAPKRFVQLVKGRLKSDEKKIVKFVEAAAS